MKIKIWSDHGWYQLKEEIIEFLKEKWHDIDDSWVHNEESVDYPDIAHEVCKKVVQENSIWILICWTGIWISIAANKIKWIRAALVHNWYEAKMAKNHNNANVICLWGRTLWPEIAKMCVDKFLNEEFEWWRHERRVNKIEWNL